MSERRAVVAESLTRLAIDHEIVGLSARGGRTISFIALAVILYSADLIKE